MYFRRDNKGLRDESVDIALDQKVVMETHVPIGGPLTEPLGVGYDEEAHDRCQDKTSHAGHFLESTDHSASRVNGVARCDSVIAD